MPLTGLIELINGWGTAPRREAGEQDWPYPPLQHLAARLGVPDEVQPGSDAALTRLADRLHPIFAVAGVQERADIVNQLLRDSKVRPVLNARASDAHAGWLVDRPTAAPLAAAAVALRAQLADHGPERLGTCAGARCADAYIDTSPAGRRRYCSLTCQNRARVAAFRHRQAANPSSDVPRG